ncbi:hypothetical protein [Methylotenera sp.]|uniref:hypothetical protein n=1 Tax=Methylotenera sp. TaxID=2051956 RepID=UPI002717BB05|nr:hypothetical protein [Methylotenera sp.]MDO9206183.1 hypothetical protein [Methylotenera sp.]MDP1523729.1 hypothetical protein [Methylotenera sp.]MDP2070891.1 hypothetical protein [Methylotenera sp.]MDP2230245.1 hypothetical protein [Methylotenera sp.]MDP3005765.1 hypothetical protein [Methylotenera sp.]
MKPIALIVVIFTQMAFMQAATAEEAKDTTEIPTLERDFVNAIHGFDKAKIIAQFGEPAKADDVKIKGSQKVVASIWQYHFINTAPDGSYYETTELDFIDDKVVQVVFMNNDGSEGSDKAQTFEVPTTSPEL